MTRRAAILSRLKSAFRASVGEVRKDPAIVGKVINSACTELGLDPLASGYVSSKAQKAAKVPDA